MATLTLRLSKGSALTFAELDSNFQAINNQIGSLLADVAAERVLAQTAKTAAETAQTAAETAKTAAETALDTFDDIYLGSKSSDPTLDNDGDALQDGAIYFNTTTNKVRVYDLGTTSWANAVDPFTGATQAQQEAASATDVAVTPGVQQFHPGTAKAWVAFNGTGTLAIRDSHNVSSVVDNGVSDYTVNWDTDFSSSDYTFLGMAQDPGVFFPNVTGDPFNAPAAGALRVRTENGLNGGVDIAYICVAAFGDQ